MTKVRFTIRRSLEQIRRRAADVDPARLHSTTDTDIERHASEDDDDPVASLDDYQLVVPVKDIRTRLGMTQDQFAKALRLPLSTLRNWEQQRVTPDPAARSLLLIVSRNPKAALEALDDE